MMTFPLLKRGKSTIYITAQIKAAEKNENKSLNPIFDSVRRLRQFSN